METPEQGARLRLGLALDDLGHQRGLCGRDRTASTLEGHVLDQLAVADGGVDRNLVAAQRIFAVRRVSHVLRVSFVPRVLAMVQDDLLVKLAQVVHQPKISRTCRRPSTSWSTSARLL